VRDKTLSINEIFISIQGESINSIGHNSLPVEHLGVGTPTIFIRTQGCCCSCIYCDTKYAHKSYSKDVNKMTIQQILDKCNELSGDAYKNVCITGGEPGIQDNVLYLIDALKKENYVIGIETSGAADIRIFQGRQLPEDVQIGKSAQCIVMDWKGPSAGKFTMNKMLESNWKYLRQCDQVKFLIRDRQDWDFMEKTLKHFDVLRSLDRPVILVSPVFDSGGKCNAKLIIKWLLESKLPLVLNLQIHKLIWDVNKRGV